jgi:peptidoglycan/LPS O-acetylase OafA/YrhL
MLHPPSKDSLTPLTGSAKWDILSGLRFLLALIVAATHLSLYTDSGPVRVLAAFGAFEAIMGFLVISGYSIGSSIQKRPEGFFLRRMERIYPVYLASIVIVALANQSFAKFHLADLLFLNQVVTGTSFVGPAWTLALEVWLYALAPLFLRLKVKTLQVISVGSFLLYSGYTVGRTLFHWTYYSGTSFGLNLPLLAFMWVAGFCLSLAKDHARRAFLLIGALGIAHIGLTLIIECGHSLKHHNMAGFYADFVPELLMRTGTLALVFLTFRYGLTRVHVPKFLATSLRFAGDISYPLYLVHIPAYVLCLRLGLSAWPWMLLAALLLSSFVYVSVDFYSKKREALLKKQPPTLS